MPSRSGRKRPALFPEPTVTTPATMQPPEVPPVQRSPEGVPPMAQLTPEDVEHDQDEDEEDEAAAVDVYSAPGVSFILFRRWDDTAAKFVTCGKADHGAAMDNRHARYEREVGFKRHNQERIDRCEDTRAMYEELRNDPNKAAAYEQRVVGFSLFERFVLERKQTDEYAAYLTKLEKLEKQSDGSPLPFQMPPEDFVVAWTLNLRKDDKAPYLPDCDVDHTYGTIKTYLSRIAGTVKEFAGGDVASPSNCALIRKKLGDWKKTARPQGTGEAKPKAS